MHVLESASLPYLDDQPLAPLRVSSPVHVLLADDNPTNLATAKMALESVGHSVFCVSSGEEALSALDESRFGLAFIDMHMPGMSGIEVVQIYQFVSNGAGTPVIILTADATAEAREAAEACGAIAFLTKPLRAKEFRDAVAAFAVDQSNPSLAIRTDAIYSGAPCEAIDHTEIDELIQIGVDSQELFEMVSEFEIDSFDLIRQAASFQKECDIISFKETMHALKGSAAALGAERLRVLAHQLEKVQDDVAVDHVELTKRLTAALTESITLLRERIATGASDSLQRH